MKTIAVQLNHPGVEKNYNLGDEHISGSGFYKINGQIIREWNTEPHYRKLLRQRGTYVENTETFEIKNDKLVFWGEWEGYSKFYPLTDDYAIGIHEPFHSMIGRGCQNTDPYIFGDCFKYAICSQKGITTSLDEGSLILFGTTTDSGFLLDTVFAVSISESAQSVSENNAVNYTEIYRQETLEQLGDIYLGLNTIAKSRIHKSKIWWNNKQKDFFSYVPCKVDNNQKNNKVIIPFELNNKKLMAKQKVGHPYVHFANYSVKQLWKIITDLVLAQGFYLAIKFEEPPINDSLAIINESTENRENINDGCSGKECY